MTAAVVAVALLAAVVVAVAWRGQGYSSAVAKLSTGTVWLANTNAGIVTLINGSTNEPVWRVPVAAAHTAFDAVQVDSGALVLDPDSGTLSKVSTAKLDISATAPVPVGTDTVVARDDLVYAVPAVPEQAITRRDPDTLEPVGQLSVPGGTQAAVDGNGRLWVLDATDHQLHLIDGDTVRSSRTIDAGAGATLTVVTGGVAVIQTDGLIARATPSGGSTLEVREEQLSITAQSWMAVEAYDELPDRLLLLDPEGRRLGSCPTRGDCTFISLKPHTADGAAFGTPQYQDGVVFVPDHSTGQVILVDVAEGRVRAEVSILAAPAPFELLVRDGTVWFNNPTTNEAGEIALDGAVTAIRKYVDGLTDAEVAELAAGGSSPVGSGEGLSGMGGGSGPGGGADAGPVTNSDTGPEEQATENPAAASTTTTAATTPQDLSTVTTAATAAPNGASAAAQAEAVTTPATGPPPPTTTTTTQSPGGSVAAGEGAVPGAPAPTVPNQPTAGGATGQRPVTAPSGSTPPGGWGTPAARPSTDPTPSGTGQPGTNEITGGGSATQQESADTLKAVIALSSSIVGPNRDVQFRDISTGDPDSRVWNFGDGTTSTDREPRHRWVRPGTYTVVLNIRKGDREATTDQTIHVTSELTASFTAPSGANVGESLQFTSSTTGNVQSYYWEFGDGAQPSTNRNPTHRYRAQGQYTVTLTVTDPEGRTATATRMITIRLLNRPPVAASTSVTLSGGSSRLLSLADLGISDPDGDRVTLVLSGPQDLPGGTTAGVSGQDQISIVAGSSTGAGSVRYIAEDGVGGRTSATLSVMIEVPSRPPPAPPVLTIKDNRVGSFAVAVHAGSIIAGNNSTNRYIVYVVELNREYSDSLEIVAIPGLVASQEYSLVGYIENPDGRSAASSTLRATPSGSPASVVPSAPTNLSAAAVGAKVEVAWTPPSAINPPVNGYVVQYGRAGETPLSEITTESRASLVLGLGTYEISVAAVNSAGTGLSARITYVAGPSAPGVPTNLRVEAGCCATSYGWDPPTEDGGAAILDYEVVNQRFDGTEWIQIVDAKGPLGDSWLIGETGRKITVRARNALGYGPSASAEFWWIPQIQVTPTDGGATVSLTNGGCNTTTGMAATVFPQEMYVPWYCRGPAVPPVIHLSGLNNGQEYGVKVHKLSAEGPASKDSEIVLFTPRSG